METPSRNATDTKATLRGSALLVAKGLMIGIANIIPGVSGGTFALILGVFDRMVDALHRINAWTAGAVLGLIGGGFNAMSRARFAEEWKRCDLGFLLKIGIGAVLAIFGLSKALKWLLVNEPGLTLSFFLGLIIPSLAVPWGMMKRRGWAQLIWAIPGVALTVGLALAFDDTGVLDLELSGGSLFIAFVCGAIAVSAMILPGISGSFVMLVLGQYMKILAYLNERSVRGLVWLGAMGAGCVAGLLAFSRLLNFLLRRWRSATMAFLIGLVLGSFWVLWPFKEFEAGAKAVKPPAKSAAGEGRGQVKHDVKIATAPNRMPESWAEFGRDAAALAVGLVCAVGVEMVGRRGRKEPETDEDESEEGSRPDET